jgi:hypothetical protein
MKFTLVQFKKKIKSNIPFILQEYFLRNNDNLRAVPITVPNMAALSL